MRKNGWIGFESIINKTKYFKDNYCRKGTDDELVPLEDVVKRKGKIRCHSKRFNCEVLVDVDKMILGRTVSFRSIIDKTKYFIDNYCRGGKLIPLEKVMSRHSKVRCYSNELNCEVIVNVNNIMSNRWVKFQSIIDKTKYFKDNYCRDGLLIPLEEIKKRESKIKCFSKELNCEVIVNVSAIMDGQWVLSNDWFYQWAKRHPKHITYFYIVKLSNEDGSETFYKAGVTRRSNKKRFTQYGNYKVIEEVIWIEDIAENISKLEQDVLKKYRSDYTPIHEFGGMTEVIDYNESILELCV